VGGDDGHWWNDDQLMTLLTEVLDGPAADCTEAPTLRNVTRRLGPAAGTSTAYEPGH
jgi:hypothetical protein